MVPVLLLVCAHYFIRNELPLNIKCQSSGRKYLFWDLSAMISVFLLQLSVADLYAGGGERASFGSEIVAT